MPVLVTRLQSKYKIGPRYTQLYIDTWFGEKASDTAYVKRALRTPPVSFWFDYAMTTNQRGEEFRRQVTPYLLPNAQRFLDVGCGNGGFLVAMAKAGLEAVGIEINPKLIPYTQANLQDHGLVATLIQGDILDAELVSLLGKFDLINCNDVIEHVLDAQRAMQHMVSLLNAGGSLVMKIPNKYSLNFVARDGHFDLFAITLLERPDAIRYHGCFFQTDYDVGDYFEIQYYTHYLDGLGCKSSLLPFPTPRPAWKVLPVWVKALLSYVDFIYKQKPRLPGALYRLILEKFNQFQQKLLTEMYSLVLHPSQSTQFKRKYLADFWSILVRKV